MKTAHYLVAFLACSAVTLGGISILHAQQEGTSVAAPAEAPAAAKPAAPVNDGFASTDERFFYALGFEQATRAKGASTSKKFDGEAFLKGFKDGAAGGDSSYAEGFMMGSQTQTTKEAAKKDGVDFNDAAFAQGLAAAVKGEAGRLDQDARRAAFQAFQTDMMKKQQEAAEKAKAKSKAEAKVFLDANAKKEGWQTTKSGLQYRVVTAGGAHPKATDSVKVHYRGTLVDGTEFDSSYKRNQPAEFPLNQVIAGWTEGLQLVGKGGKIELAIPSDIAYGDEGRPPHIPGGATLLFTVELLEINAAKADAIVPGLGQ